MILIDKNGKELHIGDKLKTFRGEKVTLIGMTKPHKPSSTGRVFVWFTNGTTGEYYPSVVGATWVLKSEHRQ